MENDYTDLAELVIQACTPQENVNYYLGRFCELLQELGRTNLVEFDAVETETTHPKTLKGATKEMMVQLKDYLETVPKQGVLMIREITQKPNTVSISWRNTPIVTFK